MAGTSWADLNSELLVTIASAAAVEGSSLFCYVCLRRVCAAWRSVLPPPYPCLLSLSDDRARSVSVFSFPMRRSFRLHASLGGRFDISRFPSRDRTVGSGHGRLAVADCWTVRIFALDPPTGDVDELLPPPSPTNMVDTYEYGVRKLVFAPDPDDATVVAMCGRWKIAYVDTSKSKSMRKWTTVDLGDCSKHLLDLAYDATGRKVYCLDSSGGVHVLRFPHGGGGRNIQDAPAEPPSLTLILPAAAFAPSYDVASRLTSTKLLFFCHGSIYQMWQNESSTIKSRSGLTMSANEIFVLRHDPGRQSWDVVKDLRGCSVFIGKNSSPAVVRAGTVPGVRPDCVYWIDWLRVPMVCDVATGTSKPCVLPAGACKSNCWYFGHDNMTSNH